MPPLTLLPPTTRLDDLGGAAAMGATLRELRIHAGITQRDLAAREGLHRNYLGALERGTVANPGLGTVQRLARAVDVSVALMAESFVRPAPDRAALAALRRAGAPAAAVVHGGGSEAGAPSLGRALRLLRQRRELTRAMLADATGMHKNYIGSLEEGAIASPGLLTLIRLVCGLHGDGVRDAELLATSVGLLARVFAGERVLVKAAA